MSLIQSYYILFLTWIKPIHFEGTTCNTFFSLLDKTFLLNAKNLSPNVAVDSQCQYLGLAFFICLLRMKQNSEAIWLCVQEGRGKNGGM